jgi:NADH-quinone oxidoreductase E subunit
MATLSEEALERIRRYVDRYPNARSALLPALHVAQNELGWVSRQAMEDVAGMLGMAVDQVEEVATFYSMFYKQPVGRYVLEICKTAPCSYMGADDIVDYTCGKLGIAPGQTTADGAFTLYRVECVGACHRAPVMQVNHRYYQDLTPQRIDLLVDRAREQIAESPAPSGFEIHPEWLDTIARLSP